MSFPYVQINDFDVLREAFIEKGQTVSLENPEVTTFLGDEFAGQPDDEYLLEGAEKSRDFNYERLWDVMEELVRVTQWLLTLSANILFSVYCSYYIRFAYPYLISWSILTRLLTNVDMYWPIQVTLLRTHFF